MKRSIRTKFTILTVIAIIVAVSVATVIGVISIRKIGRSDADQMLHLTCTTGAMNLESYFTSVENSVDTVATLVADSFEGMTKDDLDSQVERARHLFGKVAENTNGVLTYYFRIDPPISDTVKGFWYVRQDDGEFGEHEVTDITLYNTNDTSSLVWFTVPKATGEGVWLPPYYTENLDVRVISYNVPVYWNDKFAGVLGIEIDYRTLSEEVKKIKIFETGYAFILDENSNVIYHPQVDSDKLDLEITAIDESDYFLGSNHIRYIYEGIEKEAVWIPLSNGMRLYVAAPEAEINRGWQGLVWNIILASLVVLLIVIIIMMRFAGRFTRPLRKLTEAAKQAENGNYEFELDYTKEDELGILTHTFQEMAVHTKEHISSLSRQVYVDALTSVRNKGAYGDYIHRLQDQVDEHREDLEFAIGVFDCDDLKGINDTYGHDKGDIYLKKASQLICHVFQHSPVFRIGGDEFAVIMQNDDYQNRDELIEQFRQSRAEICESAENKWEEVNVTMGLAVYDQDKDTAVIDVARRADRMMYEKKKIRKDMLKEDALEGDALRNDGPEEDTLEGDALAEDGKGDS